MTRVVYDLEQGRGLGLGLRDLAFSGFAVAVTWSDSEGFVHWNGWQGRDLLHYLLRHDEIVGFNLLAYDNAALSGYLLPHERPIVHEFQRRTVDLHTILLRETGRRWSLEHVARATLGEGKLPAPVDGDMEAVAEYCERDVELTRDLDDFRRMYGRLYVPEWLVPSSV